MPLPYPIEPQALHADLRDDSPAPDQTGEHQPIIAHTPKARVPHMKKTFLIPIEFVSPLPVEKNFDAFFKGSRRLSFGHKDRTK